MSSIHRTIWCLALLFGSVASLFSNSNRVNWVADGVKYAICNESEVAIIDAYNLSDTIYLPDSVAYQGMFLYVTSIEPKAFHRCTELTYIGLPSTLKIIHRSSIDHTRYFTSRKSWDARGCLQQGEYLLGVKPSANQTSFQVAEGVRLIAIGAFDDCKSLCSLRLPSTLRVLQSDILHGTRITNESNLWKDGILYLGEWAVKCKTKLPKTTTVQEGTRFMADDLFSGHRELERMILPTSMQHISRNAFAGCSNLDSIAVGDSLIQIEREAFIGCNNLRTFKCSSLTQKIGVAAFYDCMRLHHLQLSTLLPYIPLGMCYHCESLEHIDIPQSVQHIDSYAFAGCIRLTTIHLTNPNVAIYPTALEGCVLLQDYR